VVEDGRAKGTPAPIIQEGLLENRNPSLVKAEARRRLEALSTDPAWQTKISRNDPATLAEFLNLSNVARAGPNEPPWSMPFYGTPSA